MNWVIHCCNCVYLNYKHSICLSWYVIKSLRLSKDAIKYILVMLCPECIISSGLIVLCIVYVWFLEVNPVFVNHIGPDFVIICSNYIINLFANLLVYIQLLFTSPCKGLCFYECSIVLSLHRHSFLEFLRSLWSYTAK